MVTLDVLDSNAFGPGSRWTYRVESDGAGGCHVDLTIVRVPTTTKGRVLDVAARPRRQRRTSPATCGGSLRRLESRRAPS